LFNQYGAVGQMEIEIGDFGFVLAFFRYFVDQKCQSQDFWICCNHIDSLSLRQKNMNCTRCQGNLSTKNGIVLGVQRYRCKLCGYNYTVEHRSGTKPVDIKRMALQMYLEGLGFRSIGRILKVHNTTVYRWIRAFGEQVNLIRNYKPVKIMELDELHTYVGHKKLPLDLDLC
jgi:transposase-like protein